MVGSYCVAPHRLWLLYIMQQNSNSTTSLLLHSRHVGLILYTADMQHKASIIQPDRSIDDLISSATLTCNLLSHYEIKLTPFHLSFLKANTHEYKVAEHVKKKNITHHHPDHLPLPFLTSYNVLRVLFEWHFKVESYQQQFLYTYLPH